MHDNDICHGDLHEGNIVVSYKNNQYKPYLIDFEYSFYISKNEHSPIVNGWIKNNFDWTKGYWKFVDYDYTNWAWRC